MSRIVLLGFIVPFISVNAKAITFNEAVYLLKKHKSIEALNHKSKSLTEEAYLRGSWGDPLIKITTTEQNTNNPSQIMRTGIEISQKIPLTNKYGNIKSAFKYLSTSIEYDAKDKERILVKSLWEIMILRRKTLDETNILKENLNWINKILHISQNLYSNGKVPQQTLSDIQIRKSETESAISNKSFQLSQIQVRLGYLIGKKVLSLDYTTIPWDLLDKKVIENKDYREIALKHKLISNEYKIKASKLNYIPDVTISLNASRTSYTDRTGHTLGAQIKFPLPFSNEKYANHKKSIQERYSSIKEYENYILSRDRDSNVLKEGILMIQSEIGILNNRTIKFAKNSRLITSKSYSLGHSSYIELLQSELNLQNILLKKVDLESRRDLKKITLKYVLGEPLI